MLTLTGLSWIHVHCWINSMVKGMEFFNCFSLSHLLILGARINFIPPKAPVKELMQNMPVCILILSCWSYLRSCNDRKGHLTCFSLDADSLERNIISIQSLEISCDYQRLIMGLQWTWIGKSFEVTLIFHKLLLPPTPAPPTTDLFVTSLEFITLLKVSIHPVPFLRRFFFVVCLKSM